MSERPAPQVATIEPDRASDALRENERRLRAIADAMPQLVWSAHSDGVVDYYNARAAEYAGIEQRPDGSWGWQPLVHPDDLSRTWAAWTAAVEANAEYACEHRIRLADGTYRWHLSRARLVRDDGGSKWFGTATDIHDRKVAEEELRRANAILEAVNHGTPVLIALKDRESRIVYANPAVLQLIGRPPAAVVGHNDVDWYGPELGGAIVENDRRVMQTGVTETVEERTPDGRVWLCTKTPWTSPEGAILGVIVVGHDITHRKQAEDEQRANETRLQRALEEAERALLARDHVVSLVSHDLRNPLAAISMQVDLAQRTSTTAPIEPQLARMKRQIGRMTALLDELLDLTMLQAGRPLALDRKPTDLAALTREVIDTHRRTASGHEIELVANVDALVGTWDPHRLERVLENLLSNAVKYSPVGSKVRVTLAREDNRAVVRVIDRGVGIPDRDRDRVFEWFARGRNVEGTVRGTGLGLAGVRQIVAQHGGTVTVESEEGVGSTFTVELPL